MAGKRPELFDWFGRIPAAVTLLALLNFTASAAREWAYYHVIGPDFIFFNSPVDYARISIHWLPTFVLATVIIAVIEMFLSRQEGFRSEKVIVQKSPMPRFTRFFRFLPGLLFLTAVVGGGTARLLLTESHTAKEWLIPVGGCWMLFAAWFCSHPYVHARLRRTGRRLLLFGPFVAALVLAHGYDEALDDLALPHGEYRVVHSDNSVEDNIQLLRVTSPGILVLQVATRSVSFLSYESFKSIERTTGHGRESDSVQ